MQSPQSGTTVLLPHGIKIEIVAVEWSDALFRIEVREDGQDNVATWVYRLAWMELFEWKGSLCAGSLFSQHQIWPSNPKCHSAYRPFIFDAQSRHVGAASATASMIVEGLNDGIGVFKNSLIADKTFRWPATGSGSFHTASLFG